MVLDAEDISASGSDFTQVDFLASASGERKVFTFRLISSLGPLGENVSLGGPVLGVVSGKGLTGLAAAAAGKNLRSTL